MTGPQNDVSQGSMPKHIRSIAVPMTVAQVVFHNLFKYSGPLPIDLGKGAEQTVKKLDVNARRIDDLASSKALGRVFPSADGKIN